MARNRPVTFGTPSMSPETLTDRIYEAAILPEGWPAVLRGLAETAEAREAILFTAREGSPRLTASSPAFAALGAAYFTRFAAANERTRRLLALGRAGFVTDFDVYTPAEALADPIFCDFLIPNGIGRGVASAIDLPTGDAMVIDAEAPFSTEPFDPRIVQRLDALRPHLARAAMMAIRLDFEAARSATEMLARVGLAAAALTEAGRLLYANALFEAEARVWSIGAGNRLHLEDRAARPLLDAALSAARAEGSARTVRSIPLGGPEAPAVLHILPVRRDARDLFGAGASLVVLTRPAPGRKVPGALLSALFDLTPAEAAVAARLAAGADAAAIARSTGRAEVTVRNQIKRVMEKTGCHRQSALIALLAALAPDWSRPGTD